MSSEFAAAPFFQQFFSDLVRVFSGLGRRSDVVKGFALQIINNEELEPNLDPSLRMDLEALAELTARLVAEKLEDPLIASELKARPVNRGGFVEEALSGWQHLLELFSGAASPTVIGIEPGPESGGAPGIGEALNFLGPALGSLQAGSLLGHLAQEVFGPSDLVGSAWESKTLPIVGPNLASFAREWELPLESVALSVLAREMAFYLISRQEKFRAAFQEMLSNFGAAARQAAQNMMEKLKNITSIEELNESLSDPEFAAAAVSMPEELISSLQGALAVAQGFAEHVKDLIVEDRLGESAVVLKEALLRRFLERPVSLRAVEQMIGINEAGTLVGAGKGFVEEIFKKVGPSGFFRAVGAAEKLPDLKDLENPSLWLALNQPR